MSYQPVAPLSGIAGWSFLNRTIARQTASYNNSSTIKRETAYFRDNIAKITSAKDLVADRRLLKVALGSFGLDDDINKQFFIRKVLEEGTANPKSMANRLVDKRYANLTNAFGFGAALGRQNGKPGFAANIISAYQTREFEIAVGNQNEPLRFALSFKREVTAIANKNSLGNTGWFRILGSAPLRSVVEKAFNLPSEFAKLNIDRQVAILKDKSSTIFGSKDIKLFLKPENMTTMINRYLIRIDSSASSAGLSSASTALTLLRQSDTSYAGSGTIEALFATLY
jgi:hypothetical protein